MDLGKYALTVLSAYGVTILLIGGLVLLTLWQGNRVRQALEAQEERMKRHG